jgi:hypothetical protein
METAARRLRFLQLACILMVLVCVGASRLGKREWRGKLTPIHYVMIVGAIWSATSGFTLQRRIANRPTESRRAAAASTPFTRWRAGNIWRIWSATMVGGWALCLSEFGGPPWLVNSFFVLGLLLLLLWRPGAAPAEAP